MRNKKCWKCAAVIGAQDKFCPQCGSPCKKLMSLNKVTGIILLGFVFVLAIRWNHDRQEMKMTSAEVGARDAKVAAQKLVKENGEAAIKAERDDKTCTDTLTAFVVSQDTVESSLKSPSSAKFPTISAPSVRVEYLGKCSHRVTAYVDAQNSFGANIRTKYVLTVKNVKGTDGWAVTELKFLQ